MGCGVIHIQTNILRYSNLPYEYIFKSKIGFYSTKYLEGVAEHVSTKAKERLVMMANRTQEARHVEAFIYFTHTEKGQF